MRRSYDATDPEQLEERQNRVDLRKQQRRADWDYVLTAPQGRRVLGEILALAGLFRGSYASGDALATAFNEGRRSIGIEVYSAITAVSKADVINDLMTEAHVGNRRNTG